jgi:hypothetical protein
MTTSEQTKTNLQVAIAMLIVALLALAGHFSFFERPDEGPRAPADGAESVQQGPAASTQPERTVVALAPTASALMRAVEHS